jgi:hypothetical protein
VRTSEERKGSFAGATDTYLGGINDQGDLVGYTLHCDASARARQSRTVCNRTFGHRGSRIQTFSRGLSLAQASVPLPHPTEVYWGRKRIQPSCRIGSSLPANRLAEDPVGLLHPVQHAGLSRRSPDSPSTAQKLRSPEISPPQCSLSALVICRQFANRAQSNELQGLA